MPDLDVEIRALVDGAAEPVTFDEVVGLRVGRTVTAPRRRVLAVAIAVVAVSVGVVLVVGLLRDGSGRRAATASASHLVDVVVSSASMEPALHEGERITAVPLGPATRLGRGAVVAYVPPRDPARRIAVARVVGLPGETIEGRAGEVLVDGSRLDESSYTRNLVGEMFGPVVIPRGSYFVLGDDRTHADGSVVHGPIGRSSIVGVVTVPPSVGAPATWELAPGATVAATTRTFSADVTRAACNSGQTGEVLEPTVTFGADDVVVTFRVEPGISGGTCQGNQAVRFVVDLGRPLGHRRLVDGICAVDADAASSAYCSDAGVRFSP
jgi:signal peptidase I